MGVHDELATPESGRWTRDQLGDKVVKYVELEETDHASFNFGKDMRFVGEVVELIKEYNPIPIMQEWDSVKQIYLNEEYKTCLI